MKNWYQVYYYRPDVYRDQEVFSFISAESETEAMEILQAKRTDAIKLRVVLAPKQPAE